jgi:nifR3 family TIM-barrel protein
MKNFWKDLPRPFFSMAPMAGYTDQPFRLMCKKYGADVLYSEMVSSEALWHNRLCHSKQSLSEYVEGSQRFRNKFGMTKNNKQLLKTLRLIQFSKIERPYVVQIFGSNPEKMAVSANYIATGEWAKDYQKILKINNLKIESIPDGIDINMGCPARNVVKTRSGAVLMKNPDLAVKIVKAIKKRVKNIPISVKTRIGWDNSDGLINFTKSLEKAGVDAIAIHGRTYKQGFAGKVDWKMIEKVNKQLKIPVIGNGGIDINSNVKIQILKLDKIMIGRGALGRPWIFEKLKNKNAKCKTKDLIGDNYDLIKNNILEHAQLVDKTKGKEGFREFRKILVWYLRNIADSKKLRCRAVKIQNLKQVMDILTEL